MVTKADETMVIVRRSTKKELSRLKKPNKRRKKKRDSYDDVISGLLSRNKTDPSTTK